MMGKFDYRELSSKERSQLLDELAAVLLSLRTPKDMRQFLQRLLTPSELFMLARRLKVAEGLVEGKSYATIREEMGVGISTIQGVDSWLEHSVRDYQDARADQRRAQKERQSVRPEYWDMPWSFGGLRHRYAGAFILLNLLLDYPGRKKKKA